MAPVPLIIGIVLMLLMTFLPGLATDSHAQADHPVALFIFWAMTAGFVRGVGFIPLSIMPRLLLSGPACGFALFLACLRMVWLERLPWLI